MSSKPSKRRRDRKPLSPGGRSAHVFGQQLRGLYSDVLSEPVPLRLQHLIETMRQAEKSRKK
ncbi:NepR family anti-sigma factor [Hyphomonas atlantica]|uniref:NepR family anti-sigma factor n=1 Tax=Hyphomonas atlantica TaxID=1280948 RepID=UPI00138E4AB9